MQLEESAQYGILLVSVVFQMGSKSQVARSVILVVVDAVYFHSPLGQSEFPH